MAEYLPTIGLEIHAELKTRTKMFCDSRNDPDETRPNVNVCPVCMGHPGTLPVINKEAVKHVLKVGVAVGGTLADFTEFDRKNYFYPDIPKGYQISQYKYPLVFGGSIADVELTRIHLEEDTATSSHDKGEYSLVDFNRAGVPLMELVTEPVIHSAKEAADFARELQLLVRCLGASDANMEKGEMRVEANISVKRIDADEESRLTRIENGLLYEELSYKIRGVVFSVYNTLGSGHKESVYQNAFAEGLNKLGLVFEKEKNIGVIYENKKVGSYQPDFVIDDKIIIEIKALPFTGKIEKQQVQYYLKNSSYRLALLINFGSSPVYIERIVYDSIRDQTSAQISADPNRRISADGNQRQSASLGTKVEVKNLNSFRAVERAIEYEIKRHTELLEAGSMVTQETRGWDEAKQQTFSQRRKEESHDYRYFPDPDIPKLLLREIDACSSETLQKEMPELPAARRARLGREFGLRPEDTEIFVGNRALGIFFEAVARDLHDAQLVLLAANYAISDLLGLIKKSGGDADAFAVAFTPHAFAELIRMLVDKKISSRGAKDVLAVLFDKGGTAQTTAERLGLMQKSDADELKRIASAVISANPNVVADFKAGKAAALQFLVGQGMKATKGAANPELLRELIRNAVG